MDHVASGKHSSFGEDQRKILYFQDFFKTSDDHVSNIEEENDPSEIFFELANAPYVGFKIESDCDTRPGAENDGDKERVDNSIVQTKDIPAVIIRQDNACQSHTGGIVWETSYLLGLYLKSKFGKQKSGLGQKKPQLGKLLEVGSGCGMLGLIMASSKLCEIVVMTETDEVMPNLIKNLEYNKSSDGFCASYNVTAKQLRWDAYKEDIKNSKDLQKHSFDTIVGTDVIFSTTLVKPLLSTLRKMSHEETNIFLCVQIRCSDSHELFLKKAAKFGFVCNDITEDLKNVKECSFGLDLECKLLHLRRSKNTVKDSKSKDGGKRKFDDEKIEHVESSSRKKKFTPSRK